MAVIPEIVKTNTRLRNYVRVYYTKGGYDPTTSIASVLTGNLEFFAALEKISFPQARGNSERRELNFDFTSTDPIAFAQGNGGIIEAIPGLVDADGASLTFIWQYKASVLERLGFNGHTLESQTRPVLFLLDLPAPTAADERQIVIPQVWLKQNPIEFGVENKDDLRIRQQVNVACQGVYML